jgi:NADPH2:quinone reductase
MRATVVDEYGDAAVLRIRELPAPVAGPGEVAIDVAYAGVNYAEVMARRGSLAPFTPPFVPGLDVSGTIRSVGDGVPGLQVGDPVAALTTRGGYAEVAIAAAALTFPLADASEATLLHGAACTTIVPTAWALLHEVARLRPAETVLVHAAAGGVGTIAGQLAAAAGAGRVVGVVSSPAKAAYARGFGYDEVLIGEGWADAAAAACGERGPDVVLDSVGGATRSRSFDVLAPLGRLVCFGNACDAPETGIPGSLLRAQVKAVLGWSVTGLAAADPQRAGDIARRALAAAGDAQIAVDITDVLPLRDAPTAHVRLEDRSSVGKLVLAVGAA